MLPMPDVMSLGKGGGGPGALVVMVLPEGSMTVKLGQTGVVYNVTPVVRVARPLPLGVARSPPPMTKVEIQITETVSGGRVIVVVKPDSVTVTRGYCVVVVILVYGGRTTVHGKSQVTVGFSMFQIVGSIFYRGV